FNSRTDVDTFGYAVLPPHGIDMDVIMTNTTQSAVITSANDRSGTASPTSVVECNTGVHKPAGIKVTKSTNETVVYPNPAGTEIFVEPAMKLDQQEEVQV